MLQTPVAKLILSLAAPTVASQLISIIYNTADTYFVSQISTSASAAVGVVFSLQSIIQAYGFGVAMGAGSLISLRLGEKKDHPGAVPGEGTVHGEVYRIDASTLAELDALRTKGGEYARHLIQTPYGSAWMYVYQRSVEGCTLIANGNWLDRDQY